MNISQPPPGRESQGEIKGTQSTDSTQLVTNDTLKMILSVVAAVIAILSIGWVVIDSAKSEIKDDLNIVRSEISQLRNEVTSLTGRMGRVEGLLERRSALVKPLDVAQNEGENSKDKNQQ